MPFIPHTQADIETMLRKIGANSLEDLFSEIPKDLLAKSLDQVPQGVPEMLLAKEMAALSQQDANQLCFIGAGAYEHHIPAAVWDIVTRGEFYTAYTPYQAEASQGTLQLLFEFQTMMASLTGMDVSNASQYDGATALAEAILMAIRVNKSIKRHRILIPETLHPAYREVVETILKQQGFHAETIGYDRASGAVSLDQVKRCDGDPITALVIPYPNFFGAIEEVDALTDWAHAQKALVIAVANPTALALLKEPGSWGETGADIVCGEAQPLGVPLASGGPYVGYLCCKKAFVRQLPGRIVGRTHDQDGKVGFTLTLQAREQHIRRAKATSNICTNQGLLVAAATIYMSLLGPEGLRRVALHSHHNTTHLQEKLTQINGVELLFCGPYFHEAVVTLPVPVPAVLTQLADQYAIQGGYDLSKTYPALGNALLVCATETKSEADMNRFANALQAILSKTTDNGFIPERVEVTS